MESLPLILITFVVLFLGIGLHEYAHCKVAELMGDPTPREMGRVTLNLFKHFDPAGTVMIIVTSIIGFGIGWGKPAPANPNRICPATRETGSIAEVVRFDLGVARQGKPHTKPLRHRAAEIPQSRTQE